MKKCRPILLFLLAFCWQLSWAQDLTVTGKVVDDKQEILPGVNVLIKGTNRGTITDANGSYSITAKKGSVLLFRSLGFASQEATVGESATINITLANDDKTLDEVVVTALGIAKDKKALGLIQKIIVKIMCGYMYK